MKRAKAVQIKIRFAFTGFKLSFRMPLIIIEFIGLFEIFIFWPVSVSFTDRNTWTKNKKLQESYQKRERKQAKTSKQLTATED